MPAFRRSLLRATVTSIALAAPAVTAAAMDSPSSARPFLSAASTSVGGPVQDQPTRGDAGEPASSQAGASPPGQDSDGPGAGPTLTGDWNGLRTTLGDAGIKFGLQEQSEVWANAAGGLRRGVVYTGLTTASLALDLDKLAGLTGATFFVNAFQIHGRGPSANLVGNIQLVSNIEATRDTKLYQMWLEQSLFDGHLIIRIGQEGASDQMMITQYGALFLNASFGFPGLTAAVLPSGGPSYPLATPFVRTEFHATDRITVVGAVYNGDPAPHGAGDPQLRDRGGDAFRLNDHALAFAELWYSVNPDDGGALPSTYKLGAWYHSGHFADQSRDTTGLSLADPASNGVPRGHTPDYALYAIADQMIWKKPGASDLGIGAFVQVVGAPAAFNISNLFIEAGLNWKGPFENRDKDVFGIAVSYLGISPATRRFGRDVVAYTGNGAPYRGNETVLEATYLCQVLPWWALQPDLQIVVNPGANIPSTFGREPLKNAVIAGVRATIVF